MKPDWDDLMETYKGHATALVADVDCTAAGKDLCNANGVKGYPTIKYGDPADLQDYSGGRDAAALKKFAAENLKPTCSPKNIDLCDDDKKATIGKYTEMPMDELGKLIATEERKMEDAEKTFTDEVSKLQAAYEQLQKDKDEAIAEVKSSGLGLMKSVKSFRAKSASGSDEL